MKDKKANRRQKILKFLAISSIITSLVLSSIALHYTSDLDELKSGEDGENTLSRIGDLYGTNGCENGGFSIQIGIDDNRDGVLDDAEVGEIRNVCHGAQGPPGPMGNRGHWGYNGTDGMNGSDGVIGTSAFIDSFTGEHGPCPHAAIIEMGNNSTSGVVDSSIKICFEELVSGRLTDIHPTLAIHSRLHVMEAQRMATYSYSLLLVMATVYCTSSRMVSSNKSLQTSTFCQEQYLVSKSIKTESGSMQTMAREGNCGLVTEALCGARPTFLQKSKKMMK